MCPISPTNFQPQNNCIIFITQENLTIIIFPHSFLNLLGSPIKIIIYHDNLAMEQLSWSTLLRGPKIDSNICQLYRWATLDFSTVPVGISQGGYC